MQLETYYKNLREVPKLQAYDIGKNMWLVIEPKKRSSKRSLYIVLPYSYVFTIMTRHVTVVSYIPVSMLSYFM